MNTNIKKKSLIINEVGKFIANCNIISLVGYSGIRSFDLKILRFFLRRSNVNVKVIKNTIAKRILKNIGCNSLVDYVSGQVMMIFSSDIFSVLLALNNLKKENDWFVIKKTVINNCLVSNDDIKNLLNFGCERNIFLNLMLILNSPLVNFLSVLRLPILAFSKSIKLIEFKKGD